MFQTTRSVLNSGAVFSGQGFQLRITGHILVVGVLQMLIPPVDGSEEFSLHAVWMAEIVYPGPRFIKGHRNHEIKLSASELFCEPYAQGYLTDIPIGRVILRGPSLALVLYTRSCGPRYQEGLVEWTDAAEAA